MRIGQRPPRRGSPYASRRREAMGRAGAWGRLGALLVTRPQDIRYLCGFTGEDSVLLLRRDEAVLISDGRYDLQARRECPDVRLVLRDGSIWEAVGQAMGRPAGRRVGVQAGHLTLAAEQALRGSSGRLRPVPLEDVVAPRRALKDEAEVGAIRRAVRVAQAAFRGLLSLGARGWVGRSERDLAGELDYRMRQAGADGAAFETIVAVGPHSALPHYRPGGTRVRAGSFVLLDWGARVEGYCSDLTRMVYLGTIPPRLAEIHRVVLRAQAAGLRACRAGATMAAVDRAARQVVAQAGYADRFVHGLGHGIGLQIHESPGLSGKAKGRLRPGMVVTVEPGIYLPGVGGVRIEDDVVIGRGGCRRLSSLPRGLSASVLA